jgi:hypothetical protein
MGDRLRIMGGRGCALGMLRREGGFKVYILSFELWRNCKGTTITSNDHDSLSAQYLLFNRSMAAE